MKYFAIIFLIGFLWITRDIIRVQETFNDSFFKRFKGHWYIDPLISWENQYKFGWLLSFIIACVSDLFHFLGTMIILAFLTLIFYAEIPIPFIHFLVIAFIIFGCGAFTGQWFWREKLNK